MSEPAIFAGYSVRTWDTDNGLPNDDITALAHTPDGYLWIGTTVGLARFDGARFVLLTTNQLPGLRTNHISGLVVEPGSGGLFVVDRTGAFTRCTQGRFEAVGFRLPHGVGKVTTLMVESNSTFWLGTEEYGSFAFIAPQYLATPITNGIPSGPVSQLVCDHQNQVWALIGDRLVTLMGKRWEEISLGLPLRAIAPSRDGGMWAATVSGYRLLDRGARVFKISKRGEHVELDSYPWAQDTLRSKITSLWEDPQERLWVGTRSEGAFFWQRASGWQRLSSEGPMAQLPIVPMMEGDEGELWFASQRGGLHRLTTSTVTDLRLPRTAGGSFVLTACAAQDSSVWVGTDGAGTFRYRDGHFQQRTNGLESLQVGVIFEDRETNLWAGTWTGLHRWVGDRFEPLTSPAALTNVVLSICEDVASNIWICTGGGLVRLHNGESRVYGKDEGIEHLYLRAVTVDSAGQIWVAITDKGLFRLEGDRFLRTGVGRWSGAALIRALLPDADGGLWIATSGEGLFRLKGGEFRQWSTPDGLPDDTLHAIVSDSDGNLWMSSNNGIFGCSKNALLAHDRSRDPQLLFKHLTPADGLETKLCSGAGQPVIGRSFDGRLWVPNQRSLTVFAPRQTQRTGHIRQALIEEVIVDGLLRPHGGRETLEIPSPARRIEIHYTSPNLTTPEQIRFRHRLAGAEDDWVEAGDRRVVFIDRLPPGKYSFQVMAGGPEGQWHESAGGLNFKILPRWWERPAVQVSSALALLAIVSGTVWGLERGRSRRRLLQIQAQRARERERQRIAQDLHDDLGTSLTEINLLSEVASRPSASAQEVRENLAGIADKSLRMVGALDEIVWAVNPRNDTLPNLVNYLCLFAQDFLRPTQIQCRLEVAEGLPPLPLDAEQRHALYLAVKEVLANIVKHADGREVWFRIRVKESTLALVIEDNGRGFDAATMRSGRNGLLNLESRMTALRGKCTVRSAPGSGTSVILEMPLW